MEEGTITPRQLGPTSLRPCVRAACFAASLDGIDCQQAVDVFIIWIDELK
jgi:hypothetical protein